MKTKILSLALLLTLALILAAPAWAAGGQQVLSPEAQGELLKQDTAFMEAAGLGTQVTLGQMISYVIKTLLSFLGVIFVILFIYAGFLWMTAAGNEEKIGTAKKIMISATIGLAIILAAYAITYFVIDQLLEATKGGTGLD